MLRIGGQATFLVQIKSIFLMYTYSHSEIRLKTFGLCLSTPPNLILKKCSIIASMHSFEFNCPFCPGNLCLTSAMHYVFRSVLALHSFRLKLCIIRGRTSSNIAGNIACKYCQQYCLIISNIADNIGNNIAELAIFLTILSAILPATL